MKFAVLVVPFVIAVIVMVATAGPATAGTRSCGYLNPREYDVKILKGPVSCKEARKVIATVVRGGGRLHSKPKNGLEDTYWTLPGGWKCATGARAAWGCVRGGTDLNPKDELYAEGQVE